MTVRRRRPRDNPSRRYHPSLPGQRMLIRGWAVAWVMLSMTACGKSPPTTDDPSAPIVAIAAAASLTGVLNELAPVIKKQAKARITVNTAGSGTLTRQILQGAPADLFISANTQWMDELEHKGIIDPASRTNLVRNRLVLIAGPGVTDAPTSLAQLPASHGWIAIGDPASVPAGRYAKQTLVAAGVWDRLQGRVLTAVDVRAALAYVESGAAPLGIVYATDAASAPSSRVALRLPDHLHSPIVYPAAVLQDAANPATAKRVLKLFRSHLAQRLFKHAGFEPGPAMEDEH